MMNRQSFCAGVIGARGYTGQELVGLLQGHPRLELVFATSESAAGEAVPGTALRYVPARRAGLGAADVVFVCLPTGEAAPYALRARAAGARVVDLSQDLRSGRGGAVYGLPELWREEVRTALLVANPGCYPTGALLAVAPAVSEGLVAPGARIVVNAASGVTGAGRRAREDLLFGEVAENVRAYSTGNRHRHVPEIGAALERLAGGEAPGFVFTPHLLPVRRGILETICLPLRSPLGTEAAVELWRSYYEGERFVEVRGALDGGGIPGPPSLRGVVGRDRVVLWLTEVAGEGAPMLQVVAALDNLRKGAAGQAVQNANLMLGMDEAEGLIP